MVKPDDPLVSNLTTLQPRDDLSAFGVLSHCANEARSGKLASAIVIGLSADGELLVRCSRMSRKDALWLLELAKQHALGK